MYNFAGYVDGLSVYDPMESADCAEVRTFPAQIDNRSTDEDFDI